MKKDIRFWVVIVVATLLCIFYLAGQTLAVIDYNLAVSLDLQETELEVGKVGIAFAKGFGFGDTFVLIPLHLLGVFGLLRNKKWGVYSMFGALAINLYWPLVHLYAIYVERVAISLTQETYVIYSILLPLISIYSLWGMWYLYKNA